MNGPVQNGRIAVVGGGVIGLFIARDLARRGADVVLLEGGRCGAGASLGNGGWITPGLSAPLAEPGALGTAMRALVSPRSPFALRPQTDPAFVAWCWRFLRASTRAQWNRGAAALVALNASTMSLFDDLEKDGVDFEMHRGGLLFVAHTTAGLDGIRRGFQSLEGLGHVSEIEDLVPEQLREREPALVEGLAGGVHAHGERHVRPESLVSGMVDAVRAAGVRIVENAPVETLTKRPGGWSLRTPQEEYVVERVVVAAGSVSHRMLRPLGVRLPLEGAKGYSITGPGAGMAPRHALYLTEARVGFTPFEGGGRLAGTLELGGRDAKVRPRRVEAIRASARRYLKDWTPGAEAFEWAGVRPLAPDGLPLIGALPGHDGLYVATGHGMLGVTLAPATAHALVPLVLDGVLRPDLAPFRPDRASVAKGGRQFRPAPIGT